MSISFDPKSKMFLLQAGDSSYAMQISPQGDLYHLYYGKHISFDCGDASLNDDGFSPLLDWGGGVSFCPLPADSEISLDTVLQEFPGAGVGDFRVPAIAVRSDDGARAVHVKYVSHEVFLGNKPTLEGLPQTYLNQFGEADTLVVTLEDALLGLRVKLFYCVFANQNVLTRWAVAENFGTRTLRIESLQSACVDFAHPNYDVIDLHGAWCRERTIERRPLAHGTTIVQSRRGATGHQLNCFAALCSKQANEDQGEVFGFHLIYSGNFRIEAEVSQMHTTRLCAGINPEGFQWQLLPGGQFTTPEAVLCWSNEGLGGMSRSLHRLYRNHLVRGEWKHKQRPILLNSWEGACFNFDGQKLIDFAKVVKKADVDLLVMDDGWFGERWSDNAGLGDWQPNEKKLGCTLKELVEGVNAAGLDFGIWYEPEMISPDSDLYRAHPEWSLHIPQRDKSIARHQYVLNLSIPEVREYLFHEISGVLKSTNITYLKWDFNRNLTEVYNADYPAEQQGEIAHRFVLGLYELLERLVTAFPHILFESCSGGGGRFDPGMLYYMPQTWGSDNTDPVARLRIQYGTSVLYPAESVGAHISHNRAKQTTVQYRADIAMAGTFGYEFDPLNLTEEQLAEMKSLNDQFRAWQHIFAGGDQYRLLSPFENNGNAAWMYVTPDKSEALLQVFSVIAEPNSVGLRIYLRGLDPKALYEVNGSNRYVLHGDTLMNGGLRMQEFRRDFTSKTVHLKKLR